MNDQFNRLVISGRHILVTGGSGSFGQAFTRKALTLNPRSIRIFADGEWRMSEMQKEFKDDRIVWETGNVRDRDRLEEAMRGVDFVIHAAALKRIEFCEKNPGEAHKTNVDGSRNVLKAAHACNVKKVLCLSTDKAVAPSTTYGKTKAEMESMAVQENVYSGTRSGCTRYGNVVGSKGSVVHIFNELAPTGFLPITDEKMTRFWITLDEGVEFVIRALGMLQGGEIFVPKLRSMRVTDLAKVIAPECVHRIIGVQNGEKIHEELMTDIEARRATDWGWCYVIHPEIQGTLPEGFKYRSDDNRMLDPEEMAGML